jgi:hypothetical protein
MKIRIVLDNAYDAGGFLDESETISIDIDKMAEKVAKELLRTRNISIEKIPLTVDIGNMLYKYLQEALDGK